MKKLILFFCLLIFTTISCAQSSLDSLRLVMPLGINGDESVLKFQLNKEKTILKIITDKQEVYFEIASKKQLPADLVYFHYKYSAKELRLNLSEPYYNSTKVSENVSFDNGYNNSYDSVAFSKEFIILRRDSELKLKNRKGKICSQIQLSGLANFRLYQCQYFKCEEFYFVIPWNFGSIQNSIIIINSTCQSIFELSGKLLQTTSMIFEQNQCILIKTKDAGDFTEHQGGGELN